MMVKQIEQLSMSIFLYVCVNSTIYQSKNIFFLFIPKKNQTNDSVADAKKGISNTFRCYWYKNIQNERLFGLLIVQKVCNEFVSMMFILFLC